MLTRLERTHKRFRTGSFSRLLTPALELPEAVPPLELGSNRPLGFDFEDQLNAGPPPFGRARLRPSPGLGGGEFRKVARGPGCEAQYLP